MSETGSSQEREPLAIIGMGCRFPGAESPQAFWEGLMNGFDAIGEIPPDRWDTHRYYHPDPTHPGTMYSRQGGFLSYIDQFDAAFFGISPTEASRIDPQQRLLLEVSWEALEDAGLVPQHLAGSPTGVFIGLCNSDYGILQKQDAGSMNAYTNAGISGSIASNRISYLFDFQGPSLSVDTACSSSLVALHLACESLWRGESSLALVGGVSILLDPTWSVGFSKAYMLSPHGRCRAFDAEADGYVRGEGVGIVILKPLSAALADGHTVYGLIRATGINQDGKTPGLHQPSCSAQEALLQQVYEQAGIAPQQVYYVEAHGTGTAVGDMIEGQALGNVLGKPRPDGEWLRIGSVKTNIGHLEGASGMAALIKAALILKYRHIPASLHFQTPNPQIPFEQLKLKVQQLSEPLSPSLSPLIVGINNFGFGGTNAHIVLQEYLREPKVECPCSETSVALLPLSARSPTALFALAHSYLECAFSASAPLWRDICLSASLLREHHAYRLALVVQSQEDLKAKLLAFLNKQSQPGIANGQVGAGKAPEICFVFSGNGPQWWAMGRQLLAENERFREVVEECDRLLQPYTGWSLLAELLADEQHSRMHHTEVAQPALFALQVALTTLWKSWGVTPTAVIGHSVGEIAAAYVAGILSLEDAIQVVYHRSRLQEQTVGKGKMAAIGLSAQEAEELLSAYQGKVALASFNSPKAVTLAGDAAALTEILAMLTQQGTFVRLLPLDYAFHSPCMDPIREDLLASLSDLQPMPAQVRFISTVTGREEGGQACCADYWWENIRLPVRFAEGIHHLLDQSQALFLEIGPHPVLAPYIRECLESEGREGTILPSLRRKETELATLLSSLGTLYTLGASINWKGLDHAGECVPLPHYPWQRERYWNEPAPSQQHLRGTYRHPLLGSRLEAAPALWENILDLQILPYLADHQVQHTIVFPAVGFLETLRTAASEFFGVEACRVEQFEIHRALVLNPSKPPILQIAVSPDDQMFHIYSRPKDEQAEWITHCSGRLGRIHTTHPPTLFDVAAVRQRCQQTIDAAAFYEEMRRMGLQYGPTFQLIEKAYVGEDEALGLIRWPETLGEDYRLHPALLECLLHAFCALLFRVNPHHLTHLPMSLKEFRFYQPPRPGTHLYSHVRVVKYLPNGLLVDETLLADDGQVFAELLGLRVQAMSSAQRDQVTLDADCLYEARWLPLPRAEKKEKQQFQTTSLASTEPGKSWILFADQQGVAIQLRERLMAQGHMVLLVEKGKAWKRLDVQHFVLPPGHAQAMQWFFETLHAERTSWKQIVYLWGLDKTAEELTNATLAATVEMGCLGLVTLAQRLAKSEKKRAEAAHAEGEKESGEPMSLWIITAGAQTLTSSDQPALEQAPLYGLSRVLHQEHPDFHSKLIDIGLPHPHQHYEAETFQALCEEIQVQEQESEVLLRGSARYVNRICHTSLERSQSIADLPRDTVFRLGITTRGTLNNLILQTLPRPKVRPGEVEIAVEATGLNFKDVMLAMGLIKPEMVEDGYADASSFGLECAGRISAVGEGVIDFRVGDEVLAPARYSFSSFVVTEAAYAVHKPACVSFEEGATILLAFLTATYALCHQAKLRKGERVLIHGAAGGVGLAAIQIVQRLGGEVFATAGNQEKRDYLRSLGVRHVLDSRSLAFADEILQLTNGEGVDIVLNSLAGEAAVRSLELLRPFGRFVELGVRDFQENRRVGLRPFQRCLSYIAVDINRLERTDPALVSQIVRDIKESFEQGIYHPLPSRMYPLSQVIEAFRFMQQSQHIGKVVVAMQDPSVTVQHTIPANPIEFRSDASYLITGGLSGFGLATAQWMVEHGARHLVLAGRSGEVKPEAVAAIDAMKAAGARIQAVRVDITQEQEVATLLESLNVSEIPLRGIVHAAADWGDAPILEIDAATFTKVVAPKMLGAWNLHRLTRALLLDFFVCYSSMALLIGNNSQGSYAAGNAFLDALALSRRAEGLPALTVEWGVLAQIGYVAHHADVSEVTSRKGLHPMQPERALRLLGKLLQAKQTQMVVAEVDWKKLDAFLLTTASRARYEQLFATVQSNDSKSEQSENTPARLLSAKPGERKQLMQARLIEVLAKVLGNPIVTIDPHMTMDLGLDSLTGMELRNMLKRELQVDMPVMQLLRVQSISEMANSLLERLQDAVPA